jgi:hypothetical protein
LGLGEDAGILGAIGDQVDLETVTAADARDTVHGVRARRGLDIGGECLLHIGVDDHVDQLDVEGAGIRANGTPLDGQGLAQINLGTFGRVGDCEGGGRGSQGDEGRNSIAHFGSCCLSNKDRVSREKSNFQEDEQSLRI